MVQGSSIPQNSPISGNLPHIGFISYLDTTHYPLCPCQTLPKNIEDFQCLNIFCDLHKPSLVNIFCDLPAISGHKL